MQAFKKVKEIIRDILGLSKFYSSVQKQLDKYDKELYESENKINELSQIVIDQKACIVSLKTCVDSLQEKLISNQGFYDGLETIMSDDTWLERLNLQLSTSPTLWGSKERLHISKLASVFTCFFNTNSGDITIGDYTFAGSDVSLLAGSHDMYLTGLSRRDAEIKSGCDIVIGNGVWLGSGCTILGPCVIGNNAVIGAGAVVTAGSNIPDNALCVGIPAKVVKQIKTVMDFHGPNIRAAVEREDGVLFVEGWSEKRIVACEGNKYCGHWMIKSDAIIYTNKQSVHLLCHSEMQNKCEILFKMQSKETRVYIDQCDLKITLMLDNGLNELHVIVKDLLPEDKLFISSIQN